MTVLIVGGNSPLAVHSARLLAPSHRLRVLADGPTRLTELPAVSPGDWSQEALGAALDGVECVVWLAGLEADGEPTRTLEIGSRRIYNLCRQAVERELKRLVYVSSLELFASADPDWIVTEQFVPKPTTDPWLLSLYLGEQVVREAVREDALPAIIARVGRLAFEDDVAGRPYDPLWLDPRDAAGVLERLLFRQRLGRRRHWWGDPVVHILPDRLDAAGSGGPVRRWLHYEFAHRFAACPPREPAR